LFTDNIIEKPGTDNISRNQVLTT